MKDLVRYIRLAAFLVYYAWLVAAVFMVVVPMSQQFLAVGRFVAGLVCLVTGVLITIEMTNRAEALAKQKIFDLMGGES